MEPEDLERQISGLAALSEPVRRSLYFYVAECRREVGRDEAAQALDISRGLAGFHLDRLVKDGLLESSFRRLSGRSGPGAGRPAKLYRLASRQLSISLPPRKYELAARILADAIDTSAPAKTRDALQATARSIGRAIGADAKARAGARAGRKRLLAGTVDALASQGYQPESRARAVLLRNCPFHGLVDEHKELVCGMSLALIEGVVEGTGVDGVEAVLDPQPGFCCVALKLAKK